MICPHCRLSISNPNADLCPRCAQPLFNQPDYMSGSEQLGSAYQPTAPSAPPQPGPYPGYASQPSGSQYPNGQPHPSGSDSPPFQPMFSAPATPRWTPPMAPASAPPRSRARRTVLYIVSTVLIIGLCAGCTLALVIGLAGHKTNFATATPFPGTTPGTTILFQDPLTSNTNGWTNDNVCFFQDNAYHIKGNFVCFVPAGVSGDANITVQAKQLAGSLRYAYGIALRRANNGDGYEFDVDGNSKWLFIKFANGTTSTLVDFTPNEAIKGGLNTTNTLLVQAKGSHFEFYVNGTKVGEADDATFATGRSGLAGGGADIEVAYNNFQITAAS